MKRFLLIFVILCGIYTHGQEKNSIPSKNIQKGYFAVDYLSVNMPSINESPMGLTGIHYNLKFGNFYTGLGMYGAVKGRRGGFFTLGANAGFKNYVSNKLFIDTGIHFGGGGGAGAPDGGGAYLLPHVDLGIQFEKFSMTAGYSYINFFDEGAIQNHQIHFGLQVPIDFSYASMNAAEKEFTIGNLKASPWNQTPKRASFMLHLNNLSVKKGGALVGKTIRLAGFEFNSYINTNWFYFAKFDGAYNGIDAGYMDVILGAGYHFYFNKNRTNILTKFGIGAGGGGGVDSQGGFLLYPDLSLEQHLTNNTYLTINKGFLMTPNSYFKTSTIGVGLKYYTNINGISNNKSDQKLRRFKGIETILKHDAYLDAKRISNPTENLHQISFQLNYHLSKNIYFAGQTSFANFGNAGAYAEGIVGLGVQSNYFMNDKINMFLQGLAGGAGGGNISTGQGFILKPSIGLNYKMNSRVALRSAIGYIKASGGQLNSSFLNIGISYRLAFLMSK